jgi:hypothetical protein
MKRHKLNLTSIQYSEKELENNIKLFSSYDDWDNISKCQTLSEEFIEKYLFQLNWFLISKYQNLSEKFIEKHSDKVDWGIISFYQKLSGQFIKNYINRINLDGIMLNKKISKKLKNKIEQEIKTLKEII